MNSIILKYLGLSLLIVLTSCGNESESQAQSKTANHAIKESALLTNDSQLDDSVQLNFSTHLLAENLIDLEIDMSLFGDTWIVSPLEKDFPYGPMRISLDSNAYFDLVDTVVESPISAYRTDSIAGASYRIIRNETILKQKMRLKSAQDFEVNGQVFFVLEPICKPYEINFKLRKEGVNLLVDRL